MIETSYIFKNLYIIIDNEKIVFTDAVDIRCLNPADSDRHVHGWTLIYKWRFFLVDYHRDIEVDLKHYPIVCINSV